MPVSKALHSISAGFEQVLNYNSMKRTTEDFGLSKALCWYNYLKRQSFYITVISYQTDKERLGNSSILVSIKFEICLHLA